MQSRLDDLKHVIKTPRPLPRPKLVEAPVQGKSQQTLLDTWTAQEKPGGTTSKTAKDKGKGKGRDRSKQDGSDEGEAKKKENAKEGLVFLGSHCICFSLFHFGK